MAAIWLLVAQPRDPATGALATVRLAGGGRQGYSQLGSVDWAAGLARPPAIVQRLGFDDGEYGAGSVVQALQLRWSGAAARLAQIARLYWRDAAFALYTGPDGGGDAEMAVVLSGMVDEALTEQGAIVLAMADPGVALTKPVLTATFAGTGGIEGPAEMKGRAKRRAWGLCRNIELLSLDPANNIWVATDPSRPLKAIDQIYDRGNRASAVTVVPWAGSIAATLTALQGTACPQGGGAAAPSIGCVKWWFANPGKLTCDLRGESVLPDGTGYVDRPSDIAQKLVAAVAGPAFDAAMVTAARAARDVVAGWTVADTTSQAGAELNALLAPVSLWWGLSPAGVIELGSWGWGAPIAALRGMRVDRSRTHRPIKRISVGWRPNNTVMARGDIAQALLAGDVGGLGFLATQEVIVFGSPQLRQSDGVTIANDAAYRTIDGVAAGFYGQAAIATDGGAKNKLDGIEGGATFGGRLGLNLLREGPVGGPVYVLFDADVITNRGTAAAIWGQAAAATDGTIQAGATNNNTTYGVNAPSAPTDGDFWFDTSITPNVQRVWKSGMWQVAATVGASTGSNLYSGGALLTDASIVTGLGTALAIVGQSALATKNTVNSDTEVVDGANYKRFLLNERTKLGGVAAGATAGINLLRNGNAEAGTTEHWAFVEGHPSNLLSVDTSAARSGTSSFAMSAAVAAYSAYASRWVAVTPGGSYRWRVALQAGDGTTGAYVRVEYQTATAADFSARSGFTDVVVLTNAPTNWADYEGVWTAPPGAVLARITILNYRPAGPSTGVLRFDNVELVEQLNYLTTLGNRPVSLGSINAAEGAKLTGVAAGATVGAVTGSNLLSGVSGSALLDAGIVTSQGIALAFTGQAAIATDAGAKAKLDGVAANAGTTLATKVIGPFPPTVTGNSASYNAGTTGAVSSLFSLSGSARLTFRVPLGIHVHANLTTTDAWNGTAANIFGVAWVFTGNDFYRTQTNGVDDYLLMGQHTGGLADAWVIEYDGTNVALSVNGVIYSTVAVAAGQRVWARFSFPDGSGAGSVVQDIQFEPLTDISRSRKFDQAGRVVDPTAYNTQLLLGPGNITSLTPSYTVGASNVMVNLPAHTRTIAGPTGPIVLNYGGGSGVVAFSSYWVAYIDDLPLAGVASPTIGFSSTPDILFYPGRYQVASGTSPNSAGGGGTTSGGGGSGSGGTKPGGGPWP